MIRILIGIGLAYLLFTADSFAQVKKFEDVKAEDTFYDYIYEISRQEVINGYNDGTYKPNQPVTRGQFSKMIVKGFGLPVNTECEEFKDVSSDNMFYENIMTLKCYGLIGGYDDNTFRADEKITRAQAAKMVYILGRVIDLDNFPIFRTIQLFEDLSPDNSMFSYVDSVISIKLSNNSRIMSGYSDGKFGPDDSITRGQAAKLIIKTQNYINNGGVFEPLKSTRYSDFSDDVMEGTVIDDDEYTVNGEYEITHSANRSTLVHDGLIAPQGFDIFSKIWNSFSNVVPFKLTQKIDKMILIDEHDAIAAGVARNYAGDIDNFVLIVNQKELDNNEISKIHSIHEAAHIFTLGSDQVVFDQTTYDTFTKAEFEKRYEEAELKCKTYFALGGCANQGSYIYKFYDQFWSNKAEDYNEARDSESEDVRKEFYLKYNNEFISEYSMFSPEEDIAESFLFFVLFDKPKDMTSTVAQKVGFFYKYPDAVRLRNEIREKLDN